MKRWRPAIFISEHGKAVSVVEDDSGGFVAYTDAALLESRVRELEGEVERLRECLRRAGLRAFMRGKPPEEVADHLERVMAGWADLEKDNARLRAVVEAAKGVVKHFDDIIPEPFSITDLRAALSALEDK